MWQNNEANWKFFTCLLVCGLLIISIIRNVEERSEEIEPEKWLLLLNSEGALVAVPHKNIGYPNRVNHTNPKIQSGEELHFIIGTGSLPPPEVTNNTLDAVAAQWNYLFYLPLTIKAWVDLGAAFLLILVGPEKEWRSRNLTKFILANIENQGPMVKVFFVDDEVTRSSHDHDTVLGTNSRLYGSVVLKQHPEWVLTKDDDKVWLTTIDSDTFPVDSKSYIRSFNKSQADIRIVSPAGCCGMFKHPTNQSIEVWMYPFVYNTMTVRTWNRVMKHDVTKPVTGQRILDDLSGIFGKEKAYKNLLPWCCDEWYMDQHFLSIRIAEYVNNTQGPVRQAANGTAGISEKLLKFVNRPMDGIDRVDYRGMNAWPRSAIDLSLAGVTDAHLMHSGYAQKRWERMQQFFTAFFGEARMENEIEPYRLSYLQTRGFNSTWDI